MHFGVVPGVDTPECIPVRRSFFALLEVVSLEIFSAIFSTSVAGGDDIIWHNVLIISFRMSTPPQSRQVNIVIGDK